VDDTQNLEDLSTEQLIELVQQRTGAGVNLSFPGKPIARQIARQARPRVQETVKKYSVGSSEDQAHNMLIEGDNLQALASLYRWRGQVDLIVADPPYNTGNDFRYNDRWDEDPNDSGLGEFVRADDSARHTKWMKFMYPRLQMMHGMLKPGGVLAICIDHRELFHLGQMLDEIFQENNRLAIINWQKTAAPRSDAGHVTTTTEYVLVYARNEERAVTHRLPRKKQSDRRYGNPDLDPGGEWREANLTARSYSASYDYAIQSPLTGELHYPAGTGAWRHPKRNITKWLSEWGTDYVEKNIGDGRQKALVVKGAIGNTIPAAAKRRAEKVLDSGPWPFVWFGKNGTGRPRVKTYLERVRKGAIPVTYWADDEEPPLDVGSTSWDHEESGRSSDGVAELSAIVGSGHGFETVKPLRLIRKIVQIWCPPEGLVMDPFAGSGTTAHAVLALNYDNEADRRFILIEQGRPEWGDSYARSLTADRLKRLITGRWANGEAEGLGGGYCFKALRQAVDAEVVLQMERDEMVDTVIASHHDANRRRGSSLVMVENLSYRYLVARNADGHGFYLVWDGSEANTDLTEDVYEACVAEGSKEGLEPVYHVYARYNLFSTEDVRFYRIPDQILIDFGLDLRTEAYTGEASA
jgi:adenine-specific DNA-methyltransferase